MPRWLVKLEANAEDLDEFTSWFPNGELFAESNSDGVFLVGPRLDAYEKAGEVEAAGEFAIDECFAAISLLCPSAKKPKLSGIFREDDSGVRREHILLRSEMVISLRGRVKGGSGPTQAQLLLSASKKSPSLQNALLLWAEPNRTWPLLYRILEEVEVHLGMHANKAGLCTASKRLRFGQSANVAEIAGKDSRHAAGKFLPPAEPMTHREAASFVSGVLQSALRKVAGY